MACCLTGAKPSSEPMLKYIKWTLGNKLQWNSNRNFNIFIQESAFENAVRKMAAILSRPECVNKLRRGTVCMGQVVPVASTGVAMDVPYHSALITATRLKIVAGRWIDSHLMTAPAPEHQMMVRMARIQSYMWYVVFIKQLSGDMVPSIQIWVEKYGQTSIPDFELVWVLL